MDNEPNDSTASRPHHATEHRHGGLGQLASTAICGNDITSSCLYVSALAIVYAGRWAPVCLLLVAATLYLFRSIYAEVVGALPLNGGAYNALLNTTSKYRASIAACLTILSYMATAVISSNEAMHYLHSLWGGLPILPATIGLLGLFMLLAVIGITESSIVAIVIFLFHLMSMLLLMGCGVVALSHFGLEVLWANLQTPAAGGFWQALFFGFAAAMLGISGFESSANFVEEQAEGVFPKTLRNMWITVTVLNPGMSMLALALVPIAEFQQSYLIVFLEYFVPALLIVTVMLTRLKLLELMVFLLDEFRRMVGRERQEAVEARDLARVRWWRRIGGHIRWAEDWLYQTIQDISEQQIVFFTRGDSLGKLNRVMQYIEENEHTYRVKFVTVVNSESDVAPDTDEQLGFLDDAYPAIDIEFVRVRGEFSPGLIQSLAKEWDIPVNLMFIGSPGDHFMYGISELGGVRLIV